MHRSKTPAYVGSGSISADRYSLARTTVGPRYPRYRTLCGALTTATRSGETRGPRKRSAPRATVYNTSGLTPAGAASGRCAPG
jgi:hypothetical protein